MTIIKKFREKGIRQSIRMIFVKIKKKILPSCWRLGEQKKCLLKEILNHSYERVIIFENHFGFYNIMLQRPQHLTRALADDNTLVLYGSFYDIDYKNEDRIEKLDNHFYVLDMFYYRDAIVDLLKQSEVKKYVMVYSTDTVSIKMIHRYEKSGFSVIYEYVDDINPELISPKQISRIKDRHTYLVKSMNSYIITTATKLFENIVSMNQNANVKMICNGVDCKAFLVEKRVRDKKYLSWLNADSMKIGYYGALASWIDYELLNTLAKDKNIQLILLGMLHDLSLENSGVLKNKNVRYFGRVSYERLPEYANEFDICIIPFAINEITMATSPVKLFEYMALEKPIVTTGLPECKKYKVVDVGDSTEEFIEKVYGAYSKRTDVQYLQELRKCAQDNDWNMKAKELLDFLESGGRCEG